MRPVGCPHGMALAELESQRRPAESRAQHSPLPASAIMGDFVADHCLPLSALVNVQFALCLFKMCCPKLRIANFPRHLLAFC